MATTPETSCSDVNSGIILMHCRLVTKNLTSQGLEVWFSLNIMTDPDSSFAVRSRTLLWWMMGKAPCGQPKVWVTEKAFLQHSGKVDEVESNHNADRERQ